MKTNKIIYWITTGIIGLTMLFTAYNYLGNPQFEETFKHLGFPSYFRIELAIAKILGVAALLLPQIPTRVKEWAYAGFFFAMSGAILSHAANGDTDAKGFFAPLLLIVLTVTSWYFRPADRKISSVIL